MPENKKKYDLTVLAVEDDPDSNLFLTTFLRLFFTEVISAKDGVEGLEAYKKRGPSIVVADIAMPNMNGLEMAEKIKSVNPNVQIILQTAFDNTEYLLKALEIGIDDYLLKPLQKNAIIASLSRAADIVLLERELEAKNKNIRKISHAVEQSSNLTLILDGKGTIEYANSKFFEFFDFNKSEVYGKSTEETLKNNFGAAVLGNLRESIEAGSDWTDEFSIDKEGACCWFKANLSAVKDEGGKIRNYSLLLIDVTALKKAEKELRQINENLEKRVEERTAQLKRAKDEAEAANRAKSAFLAKVSHELRTPLNGIIGLTGILLDDKLSEKQINFLEMIKESGENLLKIINDIINYSKLESGKLKLDETVFVPKVCAVNATELLSKSAEDKGLAIKVSIDESLPEKIIGDPVRLQQIITNLLENAIKFTEEGAVEVKAKKIEEHSKMIKLQFSVKDTGTGISEDKQSELFESFSQVEDYMTRKRGGTGLGLNIAKELVDLMNGEIWVESESGGGSEFFFTASFVKPEKEDAISEDKREENLEETASQYPEANLKVLIAEDSYVNLEVLKEALSVKNWESIAATDGVEALEVYKSRDFDLILMDVWMPEKDGLEATRDIREIEKEKEKRTPIVGLTAIDGEDDERKCLEAGMDDVIAKPFELKEFFDVIYKALGIDSSGDSAEKSALNLEQLIKSINYNEDLFKNIVDYFAGKSNETIEKIEEAVKSDSFKEIKSKAHKFKSELGNFGAEKSVSILKRIERLADENNINGMEELIGDLKKAVKKVNEELKEIDIKELIKSIKGE